MGDASTDKTWADQHFATSNLGPVLVGWMLQLMFYGFGMSLLAHYIVGPQYKADSRRIKLWLWAVVLGTSLQSCISFYSIYHYGTSQQRDEQTLSSQTLVDCFATVPAGMVGALVQIFLLLRAVSLFANRIARVAFISVSALIISGGLIGSWLFVVTSFYYRTKTPRPPGLTFGLANGLWLWCCCTMDALITLTLSLLLYKRIVGFNARTDSMLRSVIVLSVENASYTACFAFVAAVLSDSFSDTSLYTNSPGVFFQPLSSFYLISFLITLNSRKSIRAKAYGYPTEAESPGAFARYPTNVVQSAPDEVGASSAAGRARSPTPQLMMMSSLGEHKSDEEFDVPPKSEKDVRIEL